MYTLLYPAVLGAMIVAVANKALETDPKPLFQFAYAIFLMLYFSAQHVQYTLDEDSYTYPKFIANLMEIVFIFLLFGMLGMIEVHIDIGGEFGVRWVSFYGLLMIVLGLPVILRKRTEKKVFPGGLYSRESALSLLSMSAAAVSLIAGALSYFDLLPALGEWIILGFLVVLLLTYILKLIFNINFLFIGSIWLKNWPRDWP